MAWAVMVEATIVWIPPGGGGATLGPSPQANVPGVGQTPQSPMAIPNAQILKVIDSEPIPVSAGAAPTLANINTALTSVVADLAGPSGTPLITPAMVTQIGNWSTGTA